jgi:WD40-like Beta Propeller Repeat
MNPNNESSQFDSSANSKKRNWLIYSLIALLCLFVGLIGYYFLFNSNLGPAPENQDVTEVGEKLADLYSRESSSEGVASVPENVVASFAEFTSPAGTLVFTGKKVEGTKRTQLYSIDLSRSDSVADVLYPEFPSLNGLAEFKDKKNPTDSFMLALTSASEVAEEDRIGIHRSNGQSSSTVLLNSTYGKFERNLEWSPQSKLLAVNRLIADHKTYVDMMPIENWEIVVVNPETDEIVDTLPGSHMPRWTPDGTKLVFLKSDGLYVYELGSKNITKILGVPEGGVVITTSMFDLSSDGKILVWSTAKAGIINIFQLDSWETGAPNFELIHKVEGDGTEYYWPTISPDGKYYAVQAIDAQNAEGFRLNARLEIRNMVKNDVLGSYTLEEFNFDALFTDVWLEQKPATPTPGGN